MEAKGRRKGGNKRRKGTEGKEKVQRMRGGKRREQEGEGDSRDTLILGNQK